MEKQTLSPSDAAWLNQEQAVPEDAHALNGFWRFLEDVNGASASDGWENPDFSDKKWPRVSLPGANHAQNGAVLYRKSFILSQDHGTRQIMLRFREICGRLSLWVNGMPVGSAEGMFVPGVFNISDAVQPERNVIALRVEPLADSGCFVGITGDILLYSLPVCGIRNVIPSMERSETGKPVLRIALTTANAEGCSVRCALMDGNRVMGYGQGSVQDQTALLTIPADEVVFWNPLAPKLYRIALILSRGERIVHTRELTFAFYDADFDGGILTVNGIPEKLFAARYSFRDPQTGCLLPEDELEQKLLRMRSCNLNAIIPESPVPESVCGLCDRLGLFLLPAGAQADTRLVIGRSPAHPSMTLRESAPDAADRAVVLKDLFSDNPDQGRIFDVDPADPARLRELRALLQPVSFRYEDNTLAVTNLGRRSFGEGHTFRYYLTRDGETVVSDVLDLQIGPGETASAVLDMQYDIFRPGRYHLNVELISPDYPIPVGFAQWEVGCLRHIFDENPGGTIREDQGTLLLRSEDAAFTVNRGSGVLEQITFRERPLLAAAMSHVYTSPGVKPSGFLRADEWEKVSAGWKKVKPSVLEVDHMTRTVSASYKLGSGLIQNFRLFSDGSLSCELRLRTGRTAPAVLGVCIPLDRSLDQFRWLGMGPDDADHAAARFYGIHTQMLNQGLGRKEPVYRLTVSDAQGFGLTIRGEDGLRISASATGNSTHLYLELPQRDLKPHTTYNFSFTIQPVQE